MAATMETTRHGTTSTASPVVLVRDVRKNGSDDGDLCALIDAAGPLSLCDLAGGLNLSVRDVALRVRRMMHEHRLRRDEWGRYRLSAA
jgi:hypothetical protein